MSELRRLIDIYVDIPNAARVRLDGESFFNPPALTLLRTQQILFRAHLLTSGTTYFTPPTDCTWYFGMDSVYTSGHADIVQSGNDEFVAADWAEADFANGKVCWRVDLAGAALAEDMGSATTKTYYCGLWMVPAGEKPVVLVEFPATVQNVATYETTPTPDDARIFVDTDMLTAYLRKQEPGQNMRFVGEKTYVYCQDDNLWYPITVRLIDGQPVLALGEGVTL